MNFVHLSAETSEILNFVHLSAETLEILKFMQWRLNLAHWVAGCTTVDFKNQEMYFVYEEIYRSIGK